MVLSSTLDQCVILTTSCYLYIYTYCKIANIVKLLYDLRSMVACLRKLNLCYVYRDFVILRAVPSIILPFEAVYIYSGSLLL